MHRKVIGHKLPPLPFQRRRQCRNAARLIASLLDAPTIFSTIHSHRRSSVIIALASPRIALTLDDGLDKIKRLLSEASAQGAQIVCFPEAYLPGLRGQDFEVLPFDLTQQERALQAVAQWARRFK